VHHAHERELGLLFDESLSLRAEMDYESTHLELDNRRMRDDLAAYVVMREQNSKLKDTLERMHEGAIATEKSHQEELEELRHSVTVIKDKLHKEFRARLHKLSGEMSEAIGSGASGEKAPQVSQAHNAKKEKETESHIKVIMDKYSELETEHDKVKLAHRLVQQSMEFQTKEMLHRKRELLESRCVVRAPAEGCRLSRISCQKLTACRNCHKGARRQGALAMQLSRATRSSEFHSEGSSDFPFLGRLFASDAGSRGSRGLRGRNLRCLPSICKRAGNARKPRKNNNFRKIGGSWRRFANFSEISASIRPCFGN